MDIAAEALRRDGVLLSVHLLAANDRCAAQVRNLLLHEIFVCAEMISLSVHLLAANDRCAAQVG